MSEPVLQSPKTAAFADLWYATRERIGKPIPAKDDFPLRELAPFMAQMSLQERDPDGRLRYLLFGTGLTADFGIDRTGEYVDQDMEEGERARRRESFDAFYAEHGQNAPYGRWLYGEASTSAGRVVEYENLALPYLEPSDGSVRIMTHVLFLATLEYGERIPPSFTEKAVRMFVPGDARPDWLALDPDSPVAQKPDVA